MPENVAITINLHVQTSLFWLTSGADVNHHWTLSLSLHAVHCRCFSLLVCAPPSFTVSCLPASLQSRQTSFGVRTLRVHRHRITSFIVHRYRITLLRRGWRHNVILIQYLLDKLACHHWPVNYKFTLLFCSKSLRLTYGLGILSCNVLFV